MSETIPTLSRNTGMEIKVMDEKKERNKRKRRV